jgi:trehalose synthase
VLAGPTPAAGLEHGYDSEVLHEMGEAYAELPAELQHDIAILALPPRPTKCAALTINALQRCSSVVVRNSLRESFCLGVTEAMWKRIPVLVSHAFGLRLQVRDRLDGRVIRDPEDPHEIARTLGEMLADPHACEAWGRSAKRRVRDEFLIFAHLHHWLATIGEVNARPGAWREPSDRTAPVPAG